MKSPATQTLFFHDYETWGVNPQKDFPCQFAGIRTDLDLNIIGKPVNLFCQIPSDYLPHPEASLVTGITPQQSLRDGLIEAEFIHKIHQQFSQPGTCVLGYNNIRFDDEVSRYTLYRNFYDPYAREWQNGNSRWDLIDMVRACYALRPQGIEWPLKEDGRPSFRLEELTEANNISHQSAHDAMSDVYATIEMAKLVKQKQPKLYDYLFALRDKNKVAAQLDCFNMTPVVHISSKLSAEHGCCTWMVPVAYHPKNKNAVMALNLAIDPSHLLSLSVAQIREKLYQPSSMLADKEQRLPIKLIHLNRCPVVAPAKTLSVEDAKRLNIDREACLRHLSIIKQHQGIQQLLADVYDQEHESKQVDPEHALYSGGFFSDQDKAKMETLRQSPPEQLAALADDFKDARLATLLFRYRARNYPSTLSHAEAVKWQRHREFRLMDENSPASIGLNEYMQRLELLFDQYQNDANKSAILKALYHYAENL